MYTKAIVRKPGKNFSQGITTARLGKPDFKKALVEHEKYCQALMKCGVEIISLEPDERYPDGCFVEDTDVVTGERAIITRPGATSRQREEIVISQILSAWKKIESIQPPGTVDGGDILKKDDHFFIGISGRTNHEGAGQLKEILSKYGYSASEIKVSTVPHLKSGAAYIGKDKFLSIEEFSERFPFSSVIRVDKDESYSANCLLVNDILLIPGGFPATKRNLIAAGYDIMEVEMSEFRKMDGGLTCLSLLF